MTSEHLEIERKYDVGDDVPWADLTSLAGVDTVGPASESALDATYYDTSQLALVRAGITLRRRTGGSDPGWHLKLPTGGGDRVEHGEPLGDTDEPVPVTLIDLVRAWVRDREVAPVAALRTRRTVHPLIGAAGSVLAEAADDMVDAHSVGGDGSATLSRWREWEIELAGGSDEPGSVELLAAAGNLMRRAGATPSPWSSKLERALGGRLAALPVRPSFVELTPRSRAGDVLHAHLAEQVEAMLVRDSQARRDEPDGVHKMRVATRRLRSALATFRPLLHREVTEPLRGELKWIAGELGGARDAEVLRMRLLDELAAEPGDLVLGPIAALIEADLRADHRNAHEKLVQALGSERYFRLLDRLDVLVVAPPFTELAEGRAEEVLIRRVRRSYQRVESLVAAGEPAQGIRRDVWYHEIRKASKRLRYAAEAVQPAFGEPAGLLAAAAEQLQEVLGEHQDSVVARAALREIGIRIHLGGDNAFTIGRLHALEQSKGEAAAAAFESAWTALSDKQVRRWLRK